ncbi:hypothetical protein K490DRAFT_63168 [Saccharata proteae CBS 121410]|uniref:Uncharacterized protein n=1 Tax=Saccharata proteae CBS 121410 TaxID=1314787 RepID=A0A9P4HZH2_9PEZI|nr:hypothetical protein K490DRAFT_63168 [Saccharata proteae CBS 121410]
MSSIHGRQNHRYIPAQRQPYSSVNEYSMSQRNPSLQRAHPSTSSTSSSNPAPTRYEAPRYPRTERVYETSRYDVPAPRHQDGYAQPRYEVPRTREPAYRLGRQSPPAVIRPDAYVGHYQTQVPAPAHLYQTEPQYPRHVQPSRSHYDRINADLARHPNRERERRDRERRDRERCERERRDQHARWYGQVSYGAAQGSLVDPSQYVGRDDHYRPAPVQTRRYATPDIVAEQALGSRWSTDSSVLAPSKSSSGNGKKGKGLFRRVFG